MNTGTELKEVCHGCSKNILIHNRFVTCKKCECICHANCANKFYVFDFTSDSWYCLDCHLSNEIKYNPFVSYKYDKYSQPDNDSIDEIRRIENILENCKRCDFKDLDNLLNDSKESLSIVFKNIDGVRSNFDLFSTEITSQTDKVSIVALAETNLDECNKDLFEIQGYISEYLSKINDKFKGSGLALYLKDSFVYTRNEEFSQCSPNLESLFVTINNTESPTTIGVVYRPPNGDITKSLNELNSLLLKLPTSNVYISGDFNIDLHNNNTNSFEDTIFANGFTPLISIATHFKSNCKPSCIDNILTNSTDTIISSGVINYNHNHSPVFCIISAICKTSDFISTLPKHDYNETNVIMFQTKLSEYVDNIDVDDSTSANESKFEMFVSKINELVDECFLVDEKIKLSKRNRIQNPWITSGIIISIKKKDLLYKNWVKSTKKLKNKAGDPLLYANFKEFRKVLKCTIQHAKRMYQIKRFDKARGNSRETWKIINDIRGKHKTTIKPSFIVDGTVIEERRVIANSFNKYFTSIASKLNECDTGIPIVPITNYTDYIKNSIESSIHLADCSIEEINDIINKLSGNKSSDISITLLKRCTHIISPILHKFLNIFLSSGIFPEILKTSIVSPVYKKGNPQLFENYRPISTLPIFSKIFEKIIYTRIYDFLIKNKILYEKQFGFRKGHSTSHAINYSVKYVSDKIEQKQHVIGIFLDLSKAFDTISHSKLLVKLQNYGIRGNCLDLITNYLSNRKQVTKFDNVKSNVDDIIYGVPQGSVLGPLLFLLYINDIIHCTEKSEFVIFADDTNLFVAANSKLEVYSIANEVLRSIYQYMSANQLHINFSKCAHMYFRPNLNNDERMSCARSLRYDQYLTLSINGHKIKQVDKIKFLGVVIDENLSWDDHIKHLENKLLSTIVLIKHVKKFIPTSHHLEIYHSLFVSHLTYGISCWGGACPSKLLKIFTIHKRCIRILFGEKLSFDHSEYYSTCARTRTYHEHTAVKNFTLEHTKPLFNKNGLLTFQNHYTLRVLVELFKIIKSHSPMPIFQLLKFVPNSQHYKLLIPDYSLNLSKNNFVRCASFLWNSCISNILDPPVLSTLKYSGCKPNTQIIIPGSNLNSDMAMSSSVYKSRVKNLLLNIQKKGSLSQWDDGNSISLEPPN